MDVSTKGCPVLLFYIGVNTMFHVIKISLFCSSKADKNDCLGTQASIF